MLSVELGGMITLRKRGLAAGVTLSQGQARGLTKGLTGTALVEDIKNQRECMKKYIDRILDVTLQATAAPAKVNESSALAPTADKIAVGGALQATDATRTTDFVVPSNVSRLFAFSQFVRTDGKLGEVIEWPPMTPTEFSQKIEGLMRFSRQRNLKLIITAKTADSNWGVVDGIRYKRQPLKRHDYYNPGVMQEHEGRLVPF